jgi:hypothetical protein
MSRVQWYDGLVFNGSIHADVSVGSTGIGNVRSGGMGGIWLPTGTCGESLEHSIMFGDSRIQNTGFKERP